MEYQKAVPPPVTNPFVQVTLTKAEVKILSDGLATMLYPSNNGVAYHSRDKALALYRQWQLLF